MTGLSGTSFYFLYLPYNFAVRNGIDPKSELYNENN